MKINRVYFNAQPTQGPPLLGGLFEAILAVFPLPLGQMSYRVTKFATEGLGRAWGGF